jgi:hypothetical protein
MAPEGADRVGGALAPVAAGRPAVAKVPPDRRIANGPPRYDPDRPGKGRAAILGRPRASSDDPRCTGTRLSEEMKRMRTFVGQIDRTCASIMAVAFVGIHVPLVSLLLFGIVNSFAGLLPILMTVLVATLVSTLASVAILFRIARPQGVDRLSRASA